MTEAGRYTRLAMIFHWVIAAAMVVNILLVWLVDSMPESAQRPMIDLHKSLGLTVLGLAALRLLWRFANPPPPMPASYRRWERLAAHAAHWALYGLIFALPITGWIHDSAWKGADTHPLNLFWVIPWFRIGAIAHQSTVAKDHIHEVFYNIHSLLGTALYALFTLHVAGALKHQFFDHERELQRMLPGGPLPSGPDEAPVQG